MYIIRKLEDAKRIPCLPIYVDSPMAIDATAIYIRHREDHNRAFASEEAKQNPLSSREIHIMRSVEESKRINNVHNRAIIISASGMATGGRVLHHLERELAASRNCVLLAGFQAEGTRGRSLEDGASFLKMHGQMAPVRAEVVNLRQFSAHAGRSELMRWLGGMPAPPKQLFIVHGEPSASRALQEAVQSQLGWQATLPSYPPDSFELTPVESR